MSLGQESVTEVKDQQSSCRISEQAHGPNVKLLPLLTLISQMHHRQPLYSNLQISDTYVECHWLLDPGSVQQDVAKLQQ